MGINVNSYSKWSRDEPNTSCIDDEVIVGLVCAVHEFFEYVNNLPFCAMGYTVTELNISFFLTSVEAEPLLNLYICSFLLSLF